MRPMAVCSIRYFSACDSTTSLLTTVVLKLTPMIAPMKAVIAMAMTTSMSVKPRGA